MQIPFREVGLGDGARSAFVTQKMAHVSQRRTRNSKFPVENSSHSPLPLNLLCEEISLAKVPMNEAFLVIQCGEGGGVRPNQGVDLIGQLGSQVDLTVPRC